MIVSIYQLFKFRMFQLSSVSWLYQFINCLNFECFNCRVYQTVRMYQLSKVGPRKHLIYSRVSMYYPQAFQNPPNLVKGFYGLPRGFPLVYARGLGLSMPRRGCTLALRASASPTITGLQHWLLYQAGRMLSRFCLESMRLLFRLIVAMLLLGRAFETACFPHVSWKACGFKWSRVEVDGRWL